MPRASLPRTLAFLIALFLLSTGAVVFLGGRISLTGAAPKETSSASPNGTASPTSAPTATASPSPSPTPEPTPTPIPTPALVAAPLTGRPVTEAQAERHVIAVMIDDLSPARPQSGLASASVVWQAPAEGGIPRYMALFQETIPGDVGPVRSSRYYFVTWAAEWKAVYAHVGGSPQALATLQKYGAGQWVYNADEFRWAGSFWRIDTRFAPHNMYTDGKHLRALAKRINADDGPIAPSWRFAPDALPDDRPKGGRITTTYRYNTIRYDYDQATNTYLRTVSSEGREHDADGGQRIAPKNVVIMVVHFAPLGDNPHKGRLEADVIGSGTAWIATNGTTIKGTWKKPSTTAPTRFYDAAGHAVTLTIGQTFVQVMPSALDVTIKNGTPPPPFPAPTPGTTPIAF
jgi:Protein of unknown function (DUF3048) N-terminal domain/Protein of unknown function (DUF3048) C-terminal domain